MGSTVISIPDGEGVPLEEKKSRFSLQPFISYLREKKKKVVKFSVPPILSHLREKKTKHDLRRIIHSVKVGTALVLVSLLYLLNPLFRRVGENAMWAIMTVVVIFEFYAGATLSKGLNRGLGTILGGGLGCLAAALAERVGGVGNHIVVGISVFIFAAAATYTRMVPSIKKRYDYGAMIFILTFNLVVVSGIRVQEVRIVARNRLSTIGMGFAICIFINLLVYPVWASDELHHSVATKFEDLALFLEGCLVEYFSFTSEKENQPRANLSSCKSVLTSKSKDEALANFAKWEPWHGRFGLYYPWAKYLIIGEHLRELAATILSLKTCLQSPKQPTTGHRENIKEPCEAVGSLIAWTLRELGESILKMRRCHAGASMVPNLKATRLELGSVLSLSPSKLTENGDHGIAMATLVFLLMEIVEKVEEVAKEVELLGEIAQFRTQLALICPSTL